MAEKKMDSLSKERAKLLDIWRTASDTNKMSVLTRIGDIDEQIAIIKENVASLSMQNKKIRPWQ